MKALAYLAASSLLLAGCTNMVTSEKPLFTKADSKGAPAFRQGVWASPDEGCDVDLKSPLDGWPKCANGDVMGPDGPLMPGGPQLNVVMAAGDPVIVQFQFPAELRKASAQLGGGMPDVGVFYSALTPTETDDKGQVVAFEGWAVECGPPPKPKSQDDVAMPSVTDRPLPGLKIVEDHCVATKASTVRAAAAASRSWQKSPHITRWIRDATN